MGIVLRVLKNQNHSFKIFGDNLFEYEFSFMRKKIQDD